MNLILKLLAVGVSITEAHYVYPALIYEGQQSTEWQYVRMTADHYNKAPVQNVLSDAIRCNEDPARAAAGTLSVTAGSTLAFNCDSGISHPGALLFYMAKVPAGKTAATWDGTGTNWFKIYQDNVIVSGGQITWPSLGVTHPSVKLPSSLPTGEYLIRVEHIALHGAQTQGGAQFYLACGQINVTNGGSGKPGPLVAFPGAYNPTDSGILYDMYSNPKPYTPPGPAVWTG